MMIYLFVYIHKDAQFCHTIIIKKKDGNGKRNFQREFILYIFLKLLIRVFFFFSFALLILNCQSFCSIFLLFYTNRVNICVFDEGEKERMCVKCQLSALSLFSLCMSLQMKEIPLVTVENKEKKEQQ